MAIGGGGVTRPLLHERATNGLPRHHRLPHGRMAYFLGMRVLRCALWFIVGVLLSTWANFTYAESVSSVPTYDIYPYDKTYRYSKNSDYCGAAMGPSPYEYRTVEDAAQPLIDRCKAHYPDARCITNQANTGCTLEKQNASGVWSSANGNVNSSLTSCPTGYTKNSSNKCEKITYACPDSSWTLSADQQTCTRPECLSGQYRDANGACVYEDCKSGRKLDAGLYTDSDGNGINKSACVAGCLAYYSGTTTPTFYQGVGEGGASGYVYIGQYNDTGMQCTQTDPVEEKSETPPEDTPEYNCIKSGQSYGYVNGQAVCLPKSSDAAAPTTSADSSTTTNPDGTSSNVASTETVNEDGTITKETTTTNYDSAGNVTGSTTTAVTSNQGAYCQQNPNSDACQRKEATGGGDCTAAPTCNGDPILCNQLKQNWHQRCETQKTNEFLGQGEQSTNDAVSAFEDAVNNPFDKSDLEQGEYDLAGMLDTTGFLSGGCIQDKIVALPMGQSLTIPFSALCPYLEYIGWAVIALSAMVALRILGVF